MRIRARHNKGLSLAEVLIAISVLTIATLAILGAMISSSQLNQKDRQITAAMNFAQRIMERIRYDTSESSAATANFDSLTSITYTVIPENPLMISEVQVVSVQTSIKKVTIIIYYINQRSTVIGPDTTRPNNGKIVQLSYNLIRP